MSISYPELPRYYNVASVSVDRVYNDLANYTSELKRLLELRDAQVNFAPSTKFYTVTNLNSIGRPQIGDVAYDSSASQFNGYIDTSIGWVPFNSGNIFSLGTYGSFYDTSTNTLVTTASAQALHINTVAESFGVSLNNNSHIQVARTGVYNFQFSAQIANSDTQIHDAAIWLRKNGTDLAGTGSKYDAPSTHGSSDGYLIAVANFFINATAGDYLEVVFASDQVYIASPLQNGVYVEAYTASTSPFTMPAIPSSVVTLTHVA